MQLAWAASIVAQAWLAVSLLRAGRRDGWTAYLVFDLLRSVALWPLSGSAYWWTWVLTQPLLMLCQFIAVGRAVEQVKLREVIHIGLIAGCSLWIWSILLTAESWPTARRVPLMLWQGATFGCFGVLAAPLVYGEATDGWMLSYFLVQTFSAIIGQITVLDPAWNCLHLWVVAALFLLWSKQEFRGTFWAN